MTCRHLGNCYISVYATKFSVEIVRGFGHWASKKYLKNLEKMEVDQQQ